MEKIDIYKDPQHTLEVLESILSAPIYPHQKEYLRGVIEEFRATVEETPRQRFDRVVQEFTEVINDPQTSEFVADALVGAAAEETPNSLTDLLGTVNDILNL